MTNYYFVTTLLPAIRLGVTPDIGSRELDFLLRLNLTPSDLKKVSAMRLLRDLENVRNLWKKQPIEPGGNLDEADIETALLFREGLPEYVFTFMEELPDQEARIAKFSELLRSYFIFEIETGVGFLHQFFTFEWQWRLVVSALRSRLLGRDLADTFHLENPEDPFVEALLAQKDEPTFTPPEPYGTLKALFDTKKDEPLEFYREFSEWRFERIEDLVGFDQFSLAPILGYVAKLDIAERWLELDKKKGLEKVAQIDNTGKKDV